MSNPILCKCGKPVDKPYYGSFCEDCYAANAEGSTNLSKNLLSGEIKRYLNQTPSIHGRSWKERGRVIRKEI